MKRAVAMLPLLVSSAALAHIQLDAPTVRYSNDLGEKNKSCPCGDGDGDSVCGGGNTSDSDGRDEGRATHLAPGSTITVRWRETVGHTGRFRVAFDDDGADLDDFNATILADIADPSDGGGDRSVKITLPDVECDRCSLQLIQVMNGVTDTPVDDPTGESTYFQCADLVLEKGAPSELPAPAGCGATPATTTMATTTLLALGLLRRRRQPRRGSRAAATLTRSADRPTLAG